MIHIVVEKSLGFGSGGWDVGYITYLIHQGRIIATTRGIHDDSRFLVNAFRRLGHLCKKHRIDSSIAMNEGRCEKLIEKLKKK